MKVVDDAAEYDNVLIHRYAETLIKNHVKTTLNYKSWLLKKYKRKRPGCTDK